MENVAMSYCNMRLLIGGSISVVIGVLMILFASYLTSSEEFDTSDYLETIAIVKSGNILSEEKVTGDTMVKTVGIIYKLNIVLEYVVYDKTYTVQYLDPKEYTTKDQVLLDLERIKARVIYYDPKDPSKNDVVRSGEDKVAMIISLISILLIICGLISIMLRKNEFFCGMTIAKDSMSLFGFR
jgi:hypothetical protein